MSVLVVLLLLEAIGLEEEVGRVLEGGDGVGSGGGGLQGARTEKCCVVGCVEEEVRNFDAIHLPTNPSCISTLSPSHPSPTHTCIQSLAHTLTPTLTPTLTTLP